MASVRPQLILPTRDLEVQERLRELNEPICLFGEDGRDRRDRLRRVLQARGLKDGVPTQQTVIFPTPNKGEEAKLADDNDEQSATESEDKEFFSVVEGEAGQALRQARGEIARLSYARAAARRAAESDQRAAISAEVEEVAAALKTFSLNEAGPEDPENQRQLQARLQGIDGPLSRRKRFLQDVGQSLASKGSHIGDGRPLSACSISSGGDHLAVGSWTGGCSVWRVVDGGGEKPTRVLKGHRARITDLQWRYSRQFAHHFDGPRSQGPGDLLVSADAEGVLLAWKPFLELDDDDNGVGAESATPFEGQHADRVNRLAWHPNQTLLASTSHDLTWRLWDLETRRTLLEQEGHSKAVFDIAFHPDGSLACSTGEDGHVRVWDLRTGKAIANFAGHSQQVYAASFHPDGVQLATGGADNQIRVWDLRKSSCRSIIAAHQSSVSRLHYDGRGHCLISAGYDHKLGVWSVNDYSRVASIAAHSSKIMGLAVDGHASERAPRIYTSGYDRSWVLIDVSSTFSC